METGNVKNTHGFWDTFGLFENLLDKAPALLGNSHIGEASTGVTTAQIGAARVGFALYESAESWAPEHDKFLDHLIETEVADLDWGEGTERPLSVFACLVFGAMMGKYSAGELDDASFFLGRAHLAAFFASRNQEIAKRFASL